MIWFSRNGRIIRMVFTDETSAQWSTLVPDAFTAQKGYDLLPELSAITDADHPNHRTVRRDLHAVLETMYAEAFDKPIAAWCSQHDPARSRERVTVRSAALQPVS